MQKVQKSSTFLAIFAAILTLHAQAAQEPNSEPAQQFRQPLQTIQESDEPWELPMAQDDLPLKHYK